MLQYTPLNTFVLRTPIFSLDFIRNILDGEDISDEIIVRILKNKVILESIFIASPSLYEQIDRFLKNKINDKKKIEKLKLSLLKYLSRMCTRCTPYGLFAGCSVGSVSDDTKIIINKITDHKRKTRLDMNFLVALSIELTKIESIKNELRFFPNSSLYKVSDKFRYIEYYYDGNKRLHDIVAIEWSDYLNKIIQKSKKGMTINEIIDIIVDKEISRSEAIEFIEELIENQVLISELEPTVSGEEFLYHIIRIIKRISNKNSSIIDFLTNIDVKLKEIDKNIGNSVNKYFELSKFIENNQLKHEINYLFQCDLTISCNRNEISKKIVNDVKKAILFLMKINRIRVTSHLNKFKENFYERYEEHEMPLSVVLDPEVGIGYGRNTFINDENPLLKGIYISPNKHIKNKVVDINWTDIDHILQTKITNALKDNLHIIELKDEDFSSIEEAPSQEFPETLSVIVELISINSNYKVKLHGGGGSSAANLLARFSHGDHKIKETVEKIVDIENDLNRNKILAEIVHLPESRVGNILSRPDFRNFEIPYLARSNKNIKNQIEIDDIGVSLKNGYIFLRSKSRNKEILPRLTNAHNYSNSNSLPIYHFLSDMQTQHNPRMVYLDLSSISALYKYIPRIEYKNIILSYATWNLSASDFKSLKESIKDKYLFRENIIDFQKKHSLPDFLIFSEGDNDLYINLNNISSVKMLISSIKNREFIKLTEFIFSENNQIVKDIDGQNYTNEIILSFYKK